MKITQNFTVARPLVEVWAFFKDVPRVAACIPGAEYLGPTEDGKHTGKVSAKVGPFQASFEGEADVSYNDADHSVQLEGKGVDRRGASRGKATMVCGLTANGNVTQVAVEADVQLSGTIAQFGRTGLITEIANVIVADFVRNAEAEITSASPEAATNGDVVGVQAELRKPTAPISGFRLLLASLRSWLRGVFGHSA